MVLRLRPANLRVNLKVKGTTEETGIPNTKEALDEATKDARAERGSLRTGDDITTFGIIEEVMEEGGTWLDVFDKMRTELIPVSKALADGQKLVNDLIKDPKFNAGSLKDFVKGLGELKTDSTFYMGVRSLGDTIREAHNELVNTAAYKAGDASTRLKANELAQAFQQTYAYHKGLLSDSMRIGRYSQEDISSMPSDLLALDGDALSQAIVNAAKDNPRNARLIDRFNSRIEQFNEYYIGNMLFSWKTQATNLMANTSNTFT